MRPGILAVLSVVLAAVLAPAAFADHQEITIEVAADHALGQCGDDAGADCYDPASVTVDTTDKVIFSNTGDTVHTFTSGVIQDDEAGLVFDSEVLQPGGSYEWEPAEAGEYPYFCLLHPWANGVITVEMHEEPEVPDAPEPVDTPEPEVPEPVDTPDPDPGDTDTDEPVTQPDEPDQPVQGTGGGCLIATAAYGTELAPQVQQLRELRDNMVMGTESGSAFMSGFNEFYYSFSPYVADLERENPVFRELVRAAITPMVYSLSMLNHVDIDTEAEMITYGVSLIALNLAMYAGIPALGIVMIARRKRD